MAITNILIPIVRGNAILDFSTPFAETRCFVQHLREDASVRAFALASLGIENFRRSANNVLLTFTRTALPIKILWRITS